MSLDMTSERVCYVHCNFCNTILAVSVPCSNMYAVVTVRCGHCANLLSVNIGALLQSLHHQELQKSSCGNNNSKESGSSSSSSSSKCSININSRYSKSTRPLLQLQAEHELPKITPIRPPEKRQRVPSAYNRFIKEEIQRIKATNPEITHREAFSTAAKNWAHFPHIHFGMNNNNNNKMEGNKQAIGAGGGSGGEGTNIHKSPAIGFY